MWRGGWGGGVRGYFTALEGWLGVGEQCDNVTLPHSSPPWPETKLVGASRTVHGFGIATLKVCERKEHCCNLGREPTLYY